MPINKFCTIVKNLHEFQIFLWYSIIFPAEFVLWFCNSWVYIFCSISVTSFSFTSFFDWKKCLPTWFLSACLTAILLHDTELFFVPLTGPTTHQSNLVLNAYGAPFLPCSTWIGSSAFEQFAPMSSPTDILYSKLSWLSTGSKYFHYFSCPGLVMSSLLTGILSLVNVAGISTHRFL